MNSWNYIEKLIKAWEEKDQRRLLTGLSVVALAYGRFLELQKRPWGKAELIDACTNWLIADRVSVMFACEGKEVIIPEDALHYLSTADQAKTDEYFLMMLSEMIEKEVDDSVASQTIESVACSCLERAEADFAEMNPKWRQI